MADGAIDPAHIARQLKRLCESQQFRSTGRLRDFLNFVVLQTVSGKSESIKEYTIGTEVYRRPPSFDPKLDSIVRVEAVKLRARLHAYFSQEHSADELEISIPKGAYVPQFRNLARSGERGRALADQSAELCELGFLSLMRRTPAAIGAAARCFAMARDLNPSEAKAQIGLADSLVASLDIEIAAPHDVLGDLRTAVFRGLRLNETFANGHVFASLYRATSEGMGTKTTEEARRALDLEPRGAMGHFWAAGLLSAQGTYDSGIEHMREAGRIWPSCSLFKAYLGRVLYYAGRNQEALMVIADITSADPKFALGHMWSALVHSEIGEHDPAIDAGLRAADVSATSATIAVAAYVLARAGRREQAEHMFDRLLASPPYGYVSPLQLAPIAEALGRREQAAGILATAQRENAWGLIWSNVDPRLKRIAGGVVNRNTRA